ncbi:MAG: methionyl-tRNA formyltransferase, partial [Acidobacteria bacterium]|nr:methionyl-tRNA formyltransferase [Acidobacteriota bacterium]
FPTAHTKFQGKKLTIWKSRVEGRGSRVKGGEILEAKCDKFLVGCGQNSVLLVEELQLEGKRRMPTRDFLNGIKVQTGEKLG